MNTFNIKEVQNLQSERKGSSFEGSLAAAKRFATKSQCFHGTTLKIEDSLGKLVAYKEGGKSWRLA